MNDEFSDRHRAIQLRLAGQSVQQICHALHRSPRWFHKWWTRYLEFGPDGLFDFSHARIRSPRRMPPDLERTILTIRRRLEARLHPGARYQLIGASAILAELQALHIRPLPSERTIERVLQRQGITLPRVRLARWISQHDLSDAASPYVQRAAPGRLCRPALPQRQAPAVLHLGLQRCLRWRRVPEIKPFAQDGRHPGVPGRLLENTGPARASAIRQCPRTGRLGTGRALSLARHSPVLALWRRTDLHPARAARSTMAASKTSTAGSNRTCCNDATPSPVS